MVTLPPLTPASSVVVVPSQCDFEAHLPDSYAMYRRILCLDAKPLYVCSILYWSDEQSSSRRSVRGHEGPQGLEAWRDSTCNLV